MGICAQLLIKWNSESFLASRGEDAQRLLDLLQAVSVFCVRLLAGLTICRSASGIPLSAAVYETGVRKRTEQVVSKIWTLSSMPYYQRCSEGVELSNYRRELRRNLERENRQSQRCYQNSQAICGVQ